MEKISVFLFMILFFCLILFVFLFLFLTDVLGIVSLVSKVMVWGVERWIH